MQAAGAARRRVRRVHMRSGKALSYKYMLLMAGGWVLLMLMGAAEAAGEGGSWLDGIWAQIDFNLIQGERYKMILEGLGVTLQVSLMAALLGFCLGMVLALMRLSNLRVGRWYPLRSIASIYVDVIRGTPVVVQLYIMYYIVMLSVSNKVLIGFITFGLNSAAYVSEIIRSGILAVDKGQTEAGRSLGLSSFMTMRLIVLPQMIKIALPSLLNEIIALLKETSVLGMIGLMDLAKSGDYIRSRTFSPAVPLFSVALIYLVMVTILSNAFRKVEGRLRASDLR